jgi:hypothetical protein
LTLPLREGVTWHDGKPFTSNDVQCTWDMLTGKSSEKLRVNPRQSWYSNLDSVTANGDYEVTFHLKRPQHHRRRTGGHWRGHAARAWRVRGHAAGDAQYTAGL